MKINEWKREVLILVVVWVAGACMAVAQERVEIPVLFEFRCPVLPESTADRSGQFVKSTVYWPDTLVESYSDGKRTGLCYGIGRNRLNDIFQWNASEATGVWFSRVGAKRDKIRIMSNFGPNTIAPGSASLFPDQYYARIFDAKGYMVEEGWYIYSESPDGDCTMKCGLFKYYSNGRLVKTRNYLEPGN